MVHVELPGAWATLPVHAEPEGGGEASPGILPESSVGAGPPSRDEEGGAPASPAATVAPESGESEGAELDEGVTPPPHPLVIASTPTYARLPALLITLPPYLRVFGANAARLV